MYRHTAVTEVVGSQKKNGQTMPLLMRCQLRLEELLEFLLCGGKKMSAGKMIVLE